MAKKFKKSGTELNCRSKILNYVYTAACAYDHVIIALIVVMQREERNLIMVMIITLFVCGTQVQYYAIVSAIYTIKTMIMSLIVEGC